MLTDAQQVALRKWYSEPRVLDEARELVARGALEQLEELLHKRCLLPLGRHEHLPGYMKDEAGQPLFPTNLDPRADVEGWRDAVEVGWEVVTRELGVTHDEVHRSIAQAQKKDWDAFLESVERRKKERGEG